MLFIKILTDILPWLLGIVLMVAVLYHLGSFAYDCKKESTKKHKPKGKNGEHYES